MQKNNLTCTIRLKWWVRFIYLPSIFIIEEICNFIGYEINPNYDLIYKTAFKSAKIDIKVGNL